MAKTLIKNAEIITAKDTDKYYIGILDDTIQVISKEVPQGYEDAQVIDAEGKIAVPGMVNTHTHAAMTLLRSYADDMVLMDWLQNKICLPKTGLRMTIFTGAQCFPLPKCLKPAQPVLPICIFQ